jgi:hypothetical protein
MDFDGACGGSGGDRGPFGHGMYNVTDGEAAVRVGSEDSEAAVLPKRHGD